MSKCMCLWNFLLDCNHFVENYFFIANCYISIACISATPHCVLLCACMTHKVAWHNITLTALLSLCNRFIMSSTQVYNYHVATKLLPGYTIVVQALPGTQDYALVVWLR